jgi:hypothetical protein
MALVGDMRWRDSALLWRIQVRSATF